MSLLLLLRARAVAPPAGDVTLTYVGAGAAPSGTGLPATGNLTATPNLPATMADGNLVLIAVGSKPDTSEITVSDPAWEFVGNGTGGAGVQGAGTGPVRESWYTRVKDPSWTAMPSFTLDGTGNCVWAHAYVIAADVADATYDVAVASGQRTTESTAWAVTCDTNPGLAAGDMVLFGGATALGSLTVSGEAITAPGATFAAATEIGEPKTTRNNDVGGFTARSTVTAGTATGAPTVTATMSAAVGATGVTTVVRVRGVAVATEPVTTVDSTRGTAWDVTETVATTRATTWDTLTATGDTRDTTWVASSPVAGVHSTTWAVAATAVPGHATVIASTAGTTTAPLPPGAQTGDMILAYAYSSTATAPTLPASWTNVTNNAATPAFRLQYRVYDGAWVMPTFTNAAQVHAILIRGQATTTPAASRGTLNATSATITWPASDTPSDLSGAAVFIRAAVHSNPGVLIPTPDGYTKLQGAGTSPGFITIAKDDTTTLGLATSPVLNSGAYSRNTVEVQAAPVVTTVTDTRGTSWGTNAPVATTHGTTWATGATITGVRDTAWTARTPVTATRGTTWAVTSPVVSTRSSTWATRSTTPGTRTTTWATRTTTATNRVTTWATSARVTGTHATTWATTAATGATRATTWATGQQVNNTRATVWNVAGTLATITATRSSTWAVAGTITTVTATHGTTWTTTAPVAVARASTWATAQPVTTARATTWTVLATAPGELLFADDFTGPAGTAPSAAYWTAATGAGGWGNNELEYYTATGNAALDGAGNLAITARQETVAGAPYTSARIHGNGKVATTYGRIEARIKVPKGQGLWPAFWMMADERVYGTWPRNGEIDIMEIVNQAVASFHSLHGPTTADPAVAWHLSRTWTSGADLSAAFHVYAVEWEPDRLSFYVDTTLVRTFTTGDMPAGSTWPFNGRPFYPLLNLAVGGGATGAVPDPAVFPATMLVDYVRIYAQAPYTQINPKVETLVTGFTDQREFDNWGPNVTLVNGQAQMTPTAAYASLVSQRRFDLTNSAVSVRLVQPPNVGAGTTQAVMQLTASTGNRIEFGWGNNALYFQEIVGGVTDATYLGYSATAHRYLRVAHDGTNIVWATSPDGATWTTRRTKVSTLPLTGVGVNLVAGYYGAETTPGTVIWDDLNAAASTTTVTSTRGTSWAVRAPVTTARATTWSLRTLLATTRPATWDTLGRLATQHAATWLIGTTVTSTRGSTWAQLEVEGPIGRITGVRWRILAASGDLSTPGAVGQAHTPGATGRLRVPDTNTDLQILEATGATR